MAPRLWLLTVGLAAALAFLGGLRCGTRPAALDARTVALQARLDSTKAADLAHARADSIWISTLLWAVDKANAAAQRARAHRDTVVARLPADTTCPDSILTYREAMAASDERGDSLESALTLSQSAVEQVQHEADLYKTRLALTETVNAGLNAALKRARPQRIFLTVSGGYGAILSGGRIVHGPGALAGLSIPIRLPWPFR